jgi:Glycosyl transferase family, helical bundle domain
MKNWHRRKSERSSASIECPEGIKFTRLIAMQSIRIPDLIQKKRDNHPLEDEEVRFFVRRLVDGTLEGCQLGEDLSR